jgi:hypothetical protein
VSGECFVGSATVREDVAEALKLSGDEMTRVVAPEPEVEAEMGADRRYP